MLYIWRNSPLGRENLLQAIHFCHKLVDLQLAVYRPVSPHGLMYFDSAVVTIDLDASYTAFPDTSEERLRTLLAEGHLPWRFVKPAGFTASTLPNIPADWQAMCCPRALSEPGGRIGLGHIGPKVQAILKHAHFPVFIPGGCFRPWERVACFFGGSELGLRAVHQAIRIAEQASLPLTIYTQLSRKLNRGKLQAMLRDAGVPGGGDDPECPWVVFDSGSLAENLYVVPSDALVVLGAAREKLVRKILVGGKLALLRSTLPNPLLAIGPRCRITL